MSGQLKLHVRFYSGQSIADQITPRPQLRKAIIARAEDNLESNSTTICNMCEYYIKKVKGLTFSVFKEGRMKLRTKVFEISAKENGGKVPKTICEMCDFYIKENPPRIKSYLK
jgi:hypothetical protein